MIVAKPKAGKSSLARQLAVCVVEGRDFLGKKVSQGDAVYLNLEGPEDVPKEHFKALGLRQEKAKLYFIHTHAPRSGAEGLERLKATLEEYNGVKLVVIDIIGKLFRLPNNDDYVAVGLAVEELERIAKQYQTHILFLTHAKKRQTDDSGDGAIGSTAFRGGTDCNIFLKKIGQRRTIETEQRWGNPIEEPTFLAYDSARREMTLGKTVDAEEDETADSRSQRNLERIETELLAALVNPLTPESKEHGPTQGELFAAVKGKTTAKLQVLDTLTSSGRLTEKKYGHAMRYQYAVKIEGAA